MISYLLHSSLLLSVTFLFYWLLLRKETFYKLNRLFLIGSVILAMVLPSITIPSWMSIKDDLFRKDAVENTTVASNKILVTEILPPENIDQVKAANAPLSSEEIVKSNEAATSIQSSGSFLNKLNYSNLFWIIYLIGVGVFILTFLIQFVLIVLTRSKLQFIQDDEYRIYEMESDTSPFSFLKWIFINPSAYDFETYDQILNHEKIHVRQAHYLDKLIAEVIVMVSWFNPFAWMLRREITNNLEFLTDDTMLRKGTERESYQMNLLKVSVPQHALSLTTNYNQSILKTRIIMMNSKKSSASSSWKYLFIIPLLGLSVISLNAVNENTHLETNEKSNEKNIESARPSDAENQSLNIQHAQDASQVVTPTDTQAFNKTNAPTKGQSAEQDQIQEDNIDLNTENDSNTKETNDKASYKSEIKIKSDDLDLKVKKKASSPFSENFKKIDQSKVKPGFWQASIESQQVCFHLNNSFGRGNWSMNECFDKSEISNFGEEKQGIFKVTRDAGTLTLKGEFEMGYGHGKFDFEGDEAFEAYLKGLGVEDVDDKLLLQLFISDASRSFLTKVNSETQGIGKKNLINLAIFVNSEEKYEELKSVFGVAGESMEYDEMISMAIHGVDKKYAEEISEIAPDGFSIQELISCKIHGVNKSLISDVQEYGFKNLSLKELMSLKIHGVDMKEMKSIEKMGFGKMSVKEVVNLKIHGVDATYVDDLKDLGLGDLSPDMIQSFAIHNIDRKHIEGVQSMGFSNLTPKEIVNTKIHGLDPGTLKEVKSMGFENLSFDQLMSFAIHNVNKSYVDGIRAEGVNDLSPDDFVNAKIHGIDGRYIRELRSLGLEDVTFKLIKKAKIHGVSARFIERARSDGYQMPKLNDYIKYKIHN